MNRPESIDRYQLYVASTQDAITDTLASQAGNLAASQSIAKASRVFFTGSGSSVPAALVGAQLLTRYTDKPAIFAPSSMLLDEVHLTSSDTIVLISQGWNRADAVLITRKVLASPATLVVLTGHPERAPMYAAPHPAQLIVAPILPESEKIFCRPSSVVTGYVKIVELLGYAIGSTPNAKQWRAAYQRGLNAPSSTLSPENQYVILTSGMLLPAGYNAALSIREGAGMYATLHEVESYGHGQYVPDQAHRSLITYILLTNAEDMYITSATDRIMHMLEGTKSQFEVWNSTNSVLLGNVELMGRIANNIRVSIEQTGWDMNNPPGMEENRPFHEVERHD